MGCLSSGPSSESYFYRFPQVLLPELKNIATRGLLTQIGLSCSVLYFVIHVLYRFQPDGEDDLKRSQLMELAIKNGTYRDSKSGAAIGISPDALVASNTRK